MPKRAPRTDPEHWQPTQEFRGGRPAVRVKRLLADYPAPTPQPTPCRLWQGAIDRDGYGCLSGRGPGNSANNHKRLRAHRWVWEQANGPIPPGLVIRHKCDNRLCYRLEHLEIGTVADNNRDAAEREHLGPVRVIPPSEIEAIMTRKNAGEIWTEIHKDYPQYSLATVKRAKEYIKDVERTLG